MRTPTGRPLLVVEADCIQIIFTITSSARKCLSNLKLCEAHVNSGILTATGYCSFKFEDIFPLQFSFRLFIVPYCMFQISSTLIVRLCTDLHIYVSTVVVRQVFVTSP